MEKTKAGQRVGKYVSYQRKKRGWTLRELSSRTGLTPSYLSRLEAGDYASASLSVMDHLSSGFEIPLPVLLEKCKITSEQSVNLPDLNFYLREKYQLPSEAVDDIKLFLDFVTEKYKSQIVELKAKHKRYWGK